MSLWLRRIYTLILILLPIVMVVSLGWYLRSEKEFFAIKDLDINFELATEQEALLLSLRPELENKMKSVKGQNIWSFGLRQFRDELLSHPWIREVEISRQFPDSIQALIHMQPVSVVYIDGRNRLFPILDSGVRMPQVKASLVPLVPLLRNQKILQDSKQLHSMLKLFNEIPFVGAFAKSNIEAVDFDPVAGLTLTLLKDSVQVHLGQESIPTKVLQVFRVLDYLESQKIKARVIDASFPKKVLVRPRKRS
jgi:cell division septal protein FtsQ